MATVQDPRSATTKHDQFVADQIEQARRKIRTYDLMVALLGLIVATLAFGVGMVLLDRWLNLGLVSRQIAFAAYLLGAFAYVLIVLSRPIRQQVNPYFAAQQVEKSLPSAKNSVINWLDLHDEALPNAIRSALGQKAASDLRQTDVDEVIRDRRLSWLGMIATALGIAILVLFFLLRPAQFFSLLGRAFAPFDSAAIATQTTITLLQPEAGDIVIPVNAPVDFRVEIGGRIPDVAATDAVRLRFRYNPEDPNFEEMRLSPSLRDPREFVVRFPATRVQNGFAYQVLAGDAATPVHHVQVRSSPLIEGFDVLYRYRPYLRFQDSTATNPNLEGIRGTEVTLTARTNRLIRDGALRIQSVRPDAPPMPPIAAEPVPDQPNALRFRFVLEEDGKHTVRFRTRDNEENGEPIPYNIKVLSDLTPNIEVTHPAPDTLPVNGKLEVEGKASDDFGLTAMRLCLQLRETAQVQQAVPLPTRPYRPEKGFKFDDGTFPRALDYRDFQLFDELKTKLGAPVVLKPGMILEYWLEAEDNCDYPRPNVGRSPLYRVTIAEAQSPEDKQAGEQQAAAGKKDHDRKQDQELARENQERKPGQGQQAPNKDAGKPEEKQPGEADKPRDNPEQQARDQELERRANELQKRMKREQNPESGENPPRDATSPEKGEPKAEGQGGERDSQPGSSPAGPKQPPQANTKGETKGEGQSTQPGDSGQPGEPKPDANPQPSEPMNPGEAKPRPQDPTQPSGDPNQGKAEQNPANPQQGQPSGDPKQGKPEQQQPGQTGQPSGDPKQGKPEQQQPGQTGQPSGDPKQGKPEQQQPGQTGQPSGDPKQGKPEQQQPGQTGQPSGDPKQGKPEQQQPGQTGQPSGDPKQGKAEQNPANSQPGESKPQAKDSPSPTAETKSPPSGGSPGECKNCKPGEGSASGGQTGSNTGGDNSQAQPPASPGSNSKPAGADNATGPSPKTGSDQSTGKPTTENRSPSDTAPKPNDQPNSMQRPEPGTGGQPGTQKSPGERPGDGPKKDANTREPNSPPNPNDPGRDGTGSKTGSGKPDVNPGDPRAQPEAAPEGAEGRGDPTKNLGEAKPRPDRASDGKGESKPAPDDASDKPAGQPSAKPQGGNSDGPLQDAPKPHEQPGNRTARQPETPGTPGSGESPKAGGQENKPGGRGQDAAKSDPKGEAKPDSLADQAKSAAEKARQIAQDLQSPDPQKREQAAKQLEDLRKQVEANPQAREALEKLAKNERAGDRPGGLKPGENPQQPEPNAQPGAQGKGEPKGRPKDQGPGGETPEGMAKQAPRPKSGERPGEGAPADKAGPLAQNKSAPRDQGQGQEPSNQPGERPNARPGQEEQPLKPGSPEAGGAGTGAPNANQRAPGDSSSEGSGTGQPGLAPDARHASRTGELQLERFPRNPTPEMLREMGMSEGEYQKFLKDLAELQKRRQAEKKVVEGDRERGGSKGSSGANTGTRKVEGAAGKADALERRGAALAPPEYRDGYRGFTEEVSKTADAPKKP